MSAAIGMTVGKTRKRKRSYCLFEKYTWQSFCLENLTFIKNDLRLCLETKLISTKKNFHSKLLWFFPDFVSKYATCLYDFAPNGTKGPAMPKFVHGWKRFLKAMSKTLSSFHCYLQSCFLRYIGIAE